MIRIRGLGAALTLLLTAPAPAQDRHQSHIPVQPSSDADIERLFRERFQNAQERAGVADLLKQFGGNGPLNPRQLLKFLNDHPELAALVEGVRTQDPETIRRLQQLLKDATQPGRFPDAETAGRIEEQLRNLFNSGNGIPPEFSSKSFVLPTPSVGQPPVDPADRAARQEIARQIAEFAQRFPKDHLPDSLRNSPAMRDLFRGLSESATAALRNPYGAEGLDAQLARFKTRWQQLGNWLPKEVPAALRKLHVPDITRMIGPRRHSLPTLEATTTVPRPAVPHVDFGTVSNVILVLVAVAVGAVAIWRVRGGRITAAAGGRRSLGPWPIDPALVASRTDLIRAFEYLSLLRCGEPARSWHHRAIAECLGGTEVQRREAATRLAALYEQARYTPGGRAEPDWTESRGPLTLLAGAG
jgi:hypothetical protein